MSGSELGTPLNLVDESVRKYSLNEDEDLEDDQINFKPI